VAVACEDVDTGSCVSRARMCTLRQLRVACEYVGHWQLRVACEDVDTGSCVSRAMVKDSGSCVSRARMWDTGSCVSRARMWTLAVACRVRVCGTLDGCKCAVVRSVSETSSPKDCAIFS